MRLASIALACLLALLTNAAAESELSNASGQSPSPAIIRSFEYFEMACLDAHGDAEFIQDFADRDGWTLNTHTDQAGGEREHWGKYVEKFGLYKLFVRILNKDGRTGLFCAVLSLSDSSPAKREKIQAETFEYIRSLKKRPYAGRITTLGSYEVDLDVVNEADSNPLLVRMSPNDRQDIMIGYGVDDGEFAVWHVLTIVPAWWVPENK